MSSKSGIYAFKNKIKSACASSLRLTTKYQKLTAMRLPLHPTSLTQTKTKKMSPVGQELEEVGG